MRRRKSDQPVNDDSPEFRKVEAGSTAGVEVPASQDARASSTSGVSPPPARLGGIVPKK